MINTARGSLKDGRWFQNFRFEGIKFFLIRRGYKYLIPKFYLFLDPECP